MDRRSLAQELRRWVVEEMGLPQQKAPTEEVLQRLFLVQRASDIWKYVIRHVRSQRTVKNIEGNLLWYQQLQHTEAQRSVEEEQQQRRKQLCQEILELRSELQHLQEQVQSAERDLTSQELNNHKSQDFCRRSLLLRAYNKKREEEWGTLRESNLRIQYLRDQLQEVSRASQRETVFPALDAVSALDTFPEPEVLRDVREVCQMRLKFLHSLYDDTVSGSLLSGGEDLRSLAHQQWMSMAEKLWSSHPPNHILVSLEHLALETTRDMRRLQSSLATDPTEKSCSISDPTCDPHERRENPETSRGMRQDSLGVLPSFSTLIQEGWSELVKVTSHLRSVQRQSQELSAHLADKIQEIHRTLSDGSELSALSRAAFEAELRLVLLRGCQDALLRECRTLQGKAADKMQEVKLLQQQQQNIQESCLLLDKKQKQIQVLITGNSSSKTQIRRGSAEVKKYIQEKLVPLPQEVVQESQRLRDSVMKDVKHFSAMSLPALQKVCADGTNLFPTQELSINRLSNPQFPYYPVYQGIYTSVGLPLYKAPETILQHVAEMKRLLLSLRCRSRSRIQAVTKLQRQLRESQSPDIDTLLQLLSAHYAQQMDQLVPKLQRLIQQCEKSQEHGKDVQAAVTYWWEQPAQLCLPWEQQGGQSLRQWRDRWTVAVTALLRASGGKA
ncbi:HAUS augmin-like complex subunit 5 [Bufo bufo]|uniref:HAUS augmin-like complex subunit 5 n=1 Tax=Bufo bufo TaxID=8384 RepID=UPI001ABEB3B4|nr:HAUS augmin-like complex subunit 5 [Bufo bufo]